MNVLNRFLTLAAISGPSGDERAVADEVIAQFDELGVVVHEDDQARAIGGNTGNLCVRIPGSSPGPAVMFGAHLDTVPLRLPVRPVVTDGIITNELPEILGADNKAAVAALVEVAARLIRRGGPALPVEFLFTPMEERRLNGAAHFDLSTVKSRLAYVFDFSGSIGRIVTSAIGTRAYCIEVGGRASHAGIEPDHGRSAVVAAGWLAARLPQGRVSTGGTGNVGTITGGTARNVVADRCRIEGEVRATSDDELDALVAGIESLCGQAAGDGIEVGVEWVYGYEPYVHDHTSPAVTMAVAALRRQGLEPEFVAAGGASDANVFNAVGMPCVNLACGMQEIHTGSEWIAADDLEVLVELVLGLIDEHVSIDANGGDR